MKTKSNALERHKGVYILKTAELGVGKTTMKDSKGGDLTSKGFCIQIASLSVKVLTPFQRKQT